MTGPEIMDFELRSGVTLNTRVWRSDSDDHPPWVLTHGLGSNARLWDGVAARLAALGHSVVTVDQRGHGQSSKPDDGYDMATCADDLALLLERLAIDLSIVQPAVGGQSWGGNVVLELGHRHTQVASLVCCVDGGFIDLQSWYPHWTEAEQKLAPPALLGTPIAQIEGWLANSAADWPPEGRAGTMANFEQRPDGTIAPWLTFERHLKVLRGLWEHRPFEIMSAVETPVLIIAVDDGSPNFPKAEPVEHALGLLPTARAEWFRPAHHDVHAQKPDEVADLLHRAAAQPDFFS